MKLPSAHRSLTLFYLNNISWMNISACQDKDITSCLLCNFCMHTTFIDNFNMHSHPIGSYALLLYKDFFFLPSLLPLLFILFHWPSLCIFHYSPTHTHKNTLKLTIGTYPFLIFLYSCSHMKYRSTCKHVHKHTLPIETLSLHVL